MNNISVNDKENQPKSSGSQKLAAVAAVYSAVKLNSLVKSNKALIEAQEKNNKVLSNIDYELIKLNKSNEMLERIQTSSLSQLEKKNERDRLRDKITDNRYHIEELRKAQKDAEEEELQRCKDIVYSISREVQTISKHTYTAVEKLLILDAMEQTLSTLSASQFRDIADKQFFNDTQDSIRNTKEIIQKNLSEVEYLDYKFACNFPNPNINEDLGVIDEEIMVLESKIKAFIKLEVLLSENKSFDSNLYSKAKKLIKNLESL